MFEGTPNFNQNLGHWNLASLQQGLNMFFNSGLSCQNYDSTLFGWSSNPSTASNIYFTSAAPLIYSHPAAVSARNSLITNKNWTISGDSYNGECQSFLGTSDVNIKKEISIYPNPAADFIYIKNIQGLNNYTIFDASGRTVLQDSLHEDKINISSLIKGSYLLKIVTKERSYNFKFIKK
ncbi:T9SS type A sorting domain-containing protein [Chryseobacterium arachidis]